MAIRTCGICKLALREDDSYQLVRLKPDDKEDVEHGLYHACGDCAAEHRERIANKPSRTGGKGKKAKDISEYDMA